jgi:hypothetical protein
MEETKLTEVTKEVYEMDKTKLMTMDDIELLSWLESDMVESERQVLLNLLVKFYNYKGE